MRKISASWGYGWAAFSVYYIFWAKGEQIRISDPGEETLLPPGWLWRFAPGGSPRGSSSAFFLLFAIRKNFRPSGDFCPKTTQKNFALRANLSLKVPQFSSNWSLVANHMVSDAPQGGIFRIWVHSQQKTCYFLVQIVLHAHSFSQSHPIRQVKFLVKSYPVCKIFENFYV